MPALRKGIRVNDPTYSFRPGRFARERTYRLHPDGFEWQDGRSRGRAAYADIARVEVSKGRFRGSTAQTFLREAKNRPNLQVLTGASATKLLLEGKRCIGVEFRRGLVGFLLLRSRFGQLRVGVGLLGELRRRLSLTVSRRLFGARQFIAGRSHLHRREFHGAGLLRAIH